MTTTDNKLTGLFLGDTRIKEKHTKFRAIQNTALEFLSKKGLPPLKNEEYKFTPVSKKLEADITQFSAPEKISLNEETIQKNLVKNLEGDVIVFNNGKFDPSLSKINGSGYTVSLLSEVEEEILETSLAKIAKIEKDPFAALNTALFEDGVFIHIHDNAVIESPISVLYFNQSNNGQVISPRVLIKVGKNAEGSVFEKSISLDSTIYFLNKVVEIEVASNSHFTTYQLQDQSKTAIEISNTESNIHRDSTFTSNVLSLQGALLRNNLSLNLLGSGCEGNMYGLYLLNGESHVDNHTNVDHTMPHAESNELYKGILADKSRGVFNGKIFVRQDAQKTNAFQQNNNILLSEDAIVNTKPQLEIWADDVKCSHGCTTGQLDEEALFYLRTRGLGKEKAKGLLLYAFAGEVMENIKNQAIKSYFIDLIQERLGSNF